METQKVDEYTFINYPEKRAKEEYNDAIRKIVDLHKDMKEVIALYCFGSIAAPGISDIDYFVVTKGEDLSFRYKLTQKEKYLFQHYPSAIVPQRLLSELHLLAPFFEIECIYQREGYNLDIPSIKISKEESRMFLADIIFMAYPRIFICMKEQRTIDVRSTLTVLYALKYPLELLKIIGIKKKEWNEFKEEIEALRKGWFEQQQREQKIIHLLKKAISVAMDIIATYDNPHQKNGENEDKHYMWKSRTIFVDFKEKYDAKSALDDMTSIYTKNKTFISILPQSIGSHLQVYAEVDNVFGKYVKKYLKIVYPKHNICSDLRKKRSEAMSTLLEYTTSINYRRGAFTPFNLGYLDHLGYVNILRDFFWELLTREQDLDFIEL